MDTQIYQVYSSVQTNTQIFNRTTRPPPKAQQHTKIARATPIATLMPLPSLVLPALRIHRFLFSCSKVKTHSFHFYYFARAPLLWCLFLPNKSLSLSLSLSLSHTHTHTYPPGPAHSLSRALIVFLSLFFYFFCPFFFIFFCPFFYISIYILFTFLIFIFILFYFSHIQKYSHTTATVTKTNTNILTYYY